MRVPVRRAGMALLVAAFLLATIAASLRLFAASSPRSAGAGTVGLTPAAGPSGTAGRKAGAGAATPGGRHRGQPAPGACGHGQAGIGAVKAPTVTVAGIAALPSAHVHPGTDTAADAVDGFYQALLGGTPSRACAYVTKPCPSFGSRPITGRVTITDAISHGRDALVQVTGSICVGTSCLPLTDRVVMPTTPASFGASWTTLISGIYGWAASPVPCVQDAATGQWHVKLR